MTCIAFDGRAIAADKRNTCGSGHLTTTKLVRVGSRVVGGCGNTAQIIEMVRWIKDGCKAKDFPASQRRVDDSVSLLLITPGGCIEQYENTPFPIAVENPFWAIGSGAPYALAAMHLGYSARQAVEVACALDPGCGNGIDEIILFPETDT